MWKTAARDALLGLTVMASLLGTTGCSSEDEPDDSGGRGPGTVTTATSGATEPVEDDGQVLPGALVGAWSSVEEKTSTATIAYRFTGGGRYKYAGLVSYLVPEGTVKITFVAEGTARVDGSTLVLRPITATRSKEDPSAPQDDYTDAPSSLAPQTYTWQVEDGRLTLTGADGNTVTYRREPT
ncbi:hypothetical protein [Streptomyces neyagawaensis]|uniref:hypothetical protein n=1 Tax=Streptomyces neyagawaensis TaxID=42238 RepID=UPI0006E433A8|nr:hypothetical protein [Streptomyces neyagawaensis]MCL6736344.1 META domain-containing protein [Streptomyces neyagawaensis]MDE1686032.1 hypothetical protein [Streptomyces neyagawaensis]